jgi:peroxiredoxin
MKCPFTFLLSAGYAVFFALSAHAVQLGEPAPPLQVSEWVRGQPVDIAAGRSNTVYVVEFWATWCPPCLENIPHLAELQQEFKASNVVVVGISDEDDPTVRRFVTRRGTNMTYHVAVDEDGKTVAAYLGDSAQSYIPVAFVVDKEGRIAWKGMGFPMVNLERTVKEILAGNFNIERGQKRESARQTLSDFVQQASMVDDEKVLAGKAAELEALDKEVGGIIPGKTLHATELLNSIKFQNAVNAYQKAIMFNKDEAEVERLDKEIQASAPADFDMAGFKERVSFLKTFDNYYFAVTGQGNTDQIPALTKKLSETNVKDARLLDKLAWVILTDEHIKTRDAHLAARFAKTAVDVSGGNDVVLLDTYARALFDTGKTADAVIWEKKALELAENDAMRNEIANTLKKYEQKTSEN